MKGIVTMKRKALIIAGALSASLLFAGCSQPAHDPGPGPDSSADQQLPGPIFFTPEELDGKSVSISQKIPLVVKIEDDKELTGWKGEATNTEIAKFISGEIRDGASFAPGFEGLSVGTTTATLSGPAGKTISFTLTVVANDQAVTRQTE